MKDFLFALRFALIVEMVKFVYQFPPGKWALRKAFPHVEA